MAKKRTDDRQGSLPLLRVMKAPPVARPLRKLVTIDRDTFAALDLYRRDSLKSWDEICEEAFRDVLAKHGRTADLKEALTRSVRAAAAAPPKPAAKARPRKKVR